MFNGPTEIINALADTGFDWVNLASNHTLDAGEAGVRKEIEIMKNYPNITYTGIADSAEAQAAPKIIERQGVKIGVESFTYGTNGINVPKPYLVNLIDKDLIRERVKVLQENSDLQIVHLHWGQEYQTSPNAEQKELAQLLADLGVTVVLGEHPHVIQPVEWLTGADNGQRTLVVYSMGNFISSQDQALRMLGLYVKFEINYNTEAHKSSVENVEILPTVTWIQKGYKAYKAIFLRDYTAQHAATHAVSGSTHEYFAAQAQKILGDQSKIIY
jgi:poly-gamma-glutamate synthesis protein (capsule biosynthesis protein)